MRGIRCTTKQLEVGSFLVMSAGQARIPSRRQSRGDSLIVRGLPLGQVYDPRGGSTRLDRLNALRGVAGGVVSFEYRK